MGTRVTQAQWDAKRAEAKAKAREALLQDAEDAVETESEGNSAEVPPYIQWSDEELIEEAEGREQDIDTTDREALIAALVADDEANGE